MTPREIDALVAEKVMGLMLHPTLRNTDYYAGGPPMVIGKGDGELGFLWGCVPNYSTDIAAAWEVVEKLTSFVSDRDKPWWSVAVFNVQKGQHSAVIYQSQPGMNIHDIHDEIAHVVDETVPMAICLAALKAVGVEVPHDAE